MTRRNWLALLLLLVWALVAAGLCVLIGEAEAGPRPCEVRPTAAEVKDVGPRLKSATDAPALSVIKDSSDRVGIVIERGGPSGTFDQAPSVRVLITDPGRGGNPAGTVIDLSWAEVVIVLGRIEGPAARFVPGS